MRRFDEKHIVGRAGPHLAILCINAGGYCNARALPAASFYVSELLSVLVRMVEAAASFKNVLMSTEADRHTSADKAITQVLSAEQTALSQIAACESRANRILMDARKAIRAMVRRTQQRISRVHAGCSVRTRELVDQMEREAEVDTRWSALKDAERDALLSVVRSVARELTEPGRTDAD